MRENNSSTGPVLAYQDWYREVNVRLSRESFLLVVVVNVVLSMCVFGIAFALFAPDRGSDRPAGLSTGQDADALRRTVDSLRAELAQAREEREALRSEFGAMTAAGAILLAADVYVWLLWIAG